MGMLSFGFNMLEGVQRNAYTDSRKDRGDRQK
jgi:hypothetical protein